MSRAHGRFLLLQNLHFHRPWWSAAQERLCPGMGGSLFDILSTRHSYVLYVICRGRRDALERPGEGHQLLMVTNFATHPEKAVFQVIGKLLPHIVRQVSILSGKLDQKPGVGFVLGLAKSDLKHFETVIQFGSRMACNMRRNIH